MQVHIVDTTLRDGEQKAGIALRGKDKVKIACLLDSLGIYQIEAGIPAMGGDEKKSIRRMAELGLKSRISAWNRMNVDDVMQSTDCHVDIIHIAAPVSDLQIKSKLNKDRDWVVDNLRRCVACAREKGFEVTVGLEDASRADPEFLLQVCAAACGEGAVRIRYADTVGILHMQRSFDEIKRMKKELKVALEIHAHNDLGMAVANSLAAARAGVEFVDCTIGGLGERAGNCDYLQFLHAARGCVGMYRDLDFRFVKEVQDEILCVIL